MTSIYLAGPMTGYPLFNFPAFRAATAHLRAAGYGVVSPAEVEELQGFDPSIPPEDFTPEDYALAMRRDIGYVLAVDAVVTLPGSDASRGAQLETAVARGIGLPVYTLREALAKGSQA